MQRSARLWSSEARRDASIASTAWLLPKTRGRILLALVPAAHWCSRGRAPASGSLEPNRAEDLSWTFCAGTGPLASELWNFCLEQTGLVVRFERGSSTPARCVGRR
jgi:hypothetical protein